ncbi:HAD-superfamily hydrolase, subfamily IA, variant 3 [Hymenobacter roseosalivarius DSM 11622]|uniref:HAD-superfamily hydrolase, subfamily IA, variant 3 n=1 Tax=Hymenobacter roseosalivarius DSM 11622 TaxID=645990 RepID=A0A1W1UYL1_9BACT|nr:HAD family phosphatase [Hymenobacter roseosalivarius]SMB85824.1 HAD-superfamily hydrolase, subfamily IA, variant 3 [Hymenobacter roseosalivarius DSM 11622]
MATASNYALIFDMDGVLIDNTAYQARAFQLLFREHGLTTNARRLLERLNGMPATNILKTVFRHPVPEKELKQYADQREFLYRVLYWNKRREVAGLTNFLTAARTAGFKIGLGTASPPETIGYIIDHLNLRHLFDTITGKADVERGKPHADTFTTAAKQLGTPPERCVVFEDAVLGEQSAYKAGMRCICLSTSVKPDKFQNPMKIIKDFTEIAPQDVLELLEQHLTAPKPDKQIAQRKYAKL